jgi:NAD(P)-dependent dehydrogenase (short-subunit alcohol dehydrogenase family)
VIYRKVDDDDTTVRMRKIRGLTALVTGAGSGIGRATSLALAAEGVRVHAVDIDPARADAIASEIVASGGAAEGHAADVADPVSVAALADALRARGERIEILVNSAGILATGSSEEIELAEWQRILGVNLFGAVHTIRAFAPPMLERGAGHVVNVASLAGLVPFPFVAPYTASKFALVGMSQAMCMELAHRGVTVTAVCPGAVRTGLYTAKPMTLPGGARERIVDLIDHHAMPPERIARDIVRAVRRRRTLVVRAGLARPLWTFYRLAPRLFLWLSRTLLGRALGGVGGASRAPGSGDER